MTDTPGEPPVRRGVTTGMVLGALLGVVLAWSSFFMALSTVPPVDGGGVAVAALSLVVPGVIGIGLLSRPGTRQAGTGFLLGLSVGMITGAGVCGLTTAALT